MFCKGRLWSILQFLCKSSFLWVLVNHRRNPRRMRNITKVPSPKLGKLPKNCKLKIVFSECFSAFFCGQFPHFGGSDRRGAFRNVSHFSAIFTRRVPSLCKEKQLAIRVNLILVQNIASCIYRAWTTRHVA